MSIGRLWCLNAEYVICDLCGECHRTLVVTDRWRACDDCAERELHREAEGPYLKGR